MASKTDASTPVAIRDVAPGVTTFSVPMRAMGLNIGGRATVVRLHSGSLAVFSAVVLTPAVREKVDSLGKLRYIVALNFEHHLHISAWAEAFPEAVVVGVEGLPEKREKNSKTRGVSFQHVFTAGGKKDMRISAEFDAEFIYEYFDASPTKELVFMHKPSRTLIQADLLFNLPATEQSLEAGDVGPVAKALVKALGTKGDLAWQKRVLWYLSSRKNRPGFSESVGNIASWDFDRVIPCHGDVIETGGKPVFRTAIGQFLEQEA